MNYAKIENGQIVEYPVYEGDIRLRFSNVSFATPFAAPDGYVSVEDSTPPQINASQNLVEADPVQVEGKWVRQWVVEDASEEQMAERTKARWDAIRSDRNHNLAACDWTQLPDAPLTNTKTAEWAEYRQALRDVTTQSDPFNIVWPVKPS